MDNIRWWYPHGRDHARWCDVPAMAAHYAVGGMVPEYRNAGAHRSVLCNCHRAAHLLHHHHHCGEPWYLDLPQTVCRRRLRAWFSLTIQGLLLNAGLQVESFIPLWEWDLPKKKSKKSKGEKSSKKGKTPEEKLQNNGGAFIEEVEESDSRPQSRSAKVEEVEDEDA